MMHPSLPAEKAMLAFYGAEKRGGLILENEEARWAACGQPYKRVIHIGGQTFGIGGSVTPDSVASWVNMRRIFISAFYLKQPNLGTLTPIFITFIQSGSACSGLGGSTCSGICSVYLQYWNARMKAESN